MRREMAVEPIPLSAAGESEPFSQEFPALSPRDIRSWPSFIGHSIQISGLRAVISAIT